MNTSKIDRLLQALEDNQEDAFVHFALAREYTKFKNLTDARKHYQHLVDHFPDYGGTYYHFVLLLWELHEPGTALEVFDQGLKILRQNNEIHLLHELQSLQDQWPE